LSKLRKPWLLGSEHLAEPRVSVAEFVRSPEFLNLDGQVHPEIVRTLKQIFDGPYDEAVLCWGIGSGKSYLASVALSYMVHCVLCLRNPQRSVGAAPGSRITFLVMGPTARQARDVVFSAFRQQIRGSPWFERRFAETVHRQTEVEFPGNVVVTAGNSSGTFPLGFNVLGAVVDEAAWFPIASDGRTEAVEDVYHGIKRRITSRFEHRGLLLVISSPRSSGDFLEQRLAEGEQDGRVFTSRRATWEVRARKLYSGRRFKYEGLSVPIEYRRAFELNPTLAMRDLAARPSRGANVFISDAAMIHRAIDADRVSPVFADGRLASDFVPRHSAPRYVHVDLGLTRDACGMAMAHCERGVGGDEAPRVRVELTHRWLAPEGGELDLSRPRELILALRERGFPIAQVSYDGWQSADSRQILSKRGITTRTVSVDRTLEPYETLKELLMDGRVSICRDAQLIQELEALELVDCRKVDHPVGGSKDVADAVAGAVSEAVRAWRQPQVRARVV
jgi:hypothetical protein